MKREGVIWTPEEQAWIEYIAGRWAEGATQKTIAAELDMPYGTMQSKLRSLGLRFRREGLVLVFAATGRPLELTVAA